MTTTEPTTLPPWINLDAIADDADQAVINQMMVLAEQVWNVAREIVPLLARFRAISDQAYVAGNLDEDLVEPIRKALGLHVPDEILSLVGQVIGAAQGETPSFAYYLNNKLIERLFTPEERVMLAELAAPEVQG